jgi:hypothetical protein
VTDVKGDPNPGLATKKWAGDLRDLLARDGLSATPTAPRGLPTGAVVEVAAAQASALSPPERFVIEVGNRTARVRLVRRLFG